MRRISPIALLAATLLVACGSQTKTVTVASAPAARLPAVSTRAAAQATTATQTASTAQAPPATTSTARAAPEPSFTESEQEAKSGTLGAAVALLRGRGYTPNDTREYHPSQSLRVLVGTRSGSDASGMQAFFFLDGRYLGTDTKQPSGTLKVVSQNDTEVALAYPLYRKGDPLCCASAGSRIVHFALNNGKLTALDPIPPASSATGPSRN